DEADVSEKDPGPLDRFVNIDFITDGITVRLLLAQISRDVHLVPLDIKFLPGTLEVVWVRGEDKIDEDYSDDDDQESEDLNWEYDPVLYDGSVWEFGAEF